MTTFDSSADPRPTVGLIELPELAELLTACGLRVVTGPDFRTAAAAIRDGFQSSGPFPLITADINAPGLRPWLGQIGKIAPVAIGIVRGAGAPALEVEGAIDLVLPFTVDTFLTSLGMPGIGGPAGAAGYPAGSAQVAPAPVAAPPVQMPEPDFGEDAFAAPAAAPRQAAPAPVPFEAEEDPFEAPAQRRPVPPVAPADDWGTEPAPAQVQEVPSRRARRAAEVPVQEAAPAAPAVAEDDWDTPAPAAAPAPAQYAPPVQDTFVAPAPAPQYAQPAVAAEYAPPVTPQQYQAPVDDDWDTPAPAAAPAPVQYAPPVQDTFVAPAPAPQYAAPAQYAPPAPQYQAPVEEDWDVPAPAPAQQYAPPVQDTFVAPAPAPVQYAPPAAPAQYAPPAPQYQTPAQNDFAAPVQHAHPAAPQYAQPAPQQHSAQDAFAAPAAQYRQPAPPQQYLQQDPFAAPAAYQQAPQARQPEFFDPAAPGQTYPAPVEQPVPYAADREAAAFFSQATPIPARRQQNPALGVSGAGQPDSSGIFDDFEASKLLGTGRSAAGMGSFIISYSGKGGVGKSTTSMQLAHKAAAAGLKVVLIDGNSGQGDLRTYLRLNRTDLPTIYDAAIGPIRNAVLTPDTINRHREQNLGEVKFAFIAAPPDDINDPDVVTHDVYRRVIEFARRNSDLVIMDTQIIESADRTGVVTQLILPALVHDAWGVGVTDMTNVGVNNLNNRLRKFLREEVPKDRLMVMINRVHPEQLEMAGKATTYFHDKATFLGSVEMDAGIGQDMNAGRINLSNHQLGSIMAKVLLRVTGNELFRAEAEGAPGRPKPSVKPAGRKAAAVPGAAKFNVMDLINRYLPGKKAA